MSERSERFVQEAEDYLMVASSLANEDHVSLTDIVRHNAISELIATAQVYATLAVATKDS